MSKATSHETQRRRLYKSPRSPLVQNCSIAANPLLGLSRPQQPHPSWYNNSLTNQITILKVEPIQLIARRLRIHNILIHHERRALGVIGDALTDLSNRTVLAEQVEQLF